MLISMMLWHLLGDLRVDRCLKWLVGLGLSKLVHTTASGHAHLIKIDLIAPASLSQADAPRTPFKQDHAKCSQVDRCENVNCARTFRLEFKIPSHICES